VESSPFKHLSPFILLPQLKLRGGIINSTEISTFKLSALRDRTLDS
jgi:hypothetical protein